MKRDWRSLVGFTALLIYMLALSFYAVKLSEENKALREQYTELLLFCNQTGGKSHGRKVQQ